MNEVNPKDGRTVREVYTNKKGGFCTECGGTVESFGGLEKCPFCGTKGVPCVFQDDVNIVINWHELRILCVWAENWALQCDKAKDGGLQKTIISIMRRLHAQHLDKAQESPLSLLAEIAQIKEKYSGTEVEGL